jgi:hypothetical protein
MHHMCHIQVELCRVVFMELFYSRSLTPMPSVVIVLYVRFSFPAFLLRDVSLGVRPSSSLVPFKITFSAWGFQNYVSSLVPACRDFRVYFVGEVLARLSKPLPGYHQRGAFLSRVCIILVCAVAKTYIYICVYVCIYIYVCVCVCVCVTAWQMSTGLLFLSYLIINLFTITQFKKDGPFDVIYCEYLAFSTAT